MGSKIGSPSQEEKKIIIGNTPHSSKLKDLNLVHSKLIDLKSKYILDELFKNLTIAKKLSIIRYNKKIQKRLDISVNDFKDNLKIEIEITLSPDKTYKYYDNFININEEKECFYHLYFDDDPKEIKIYYVEEYYELIRTIIGNNNKKMELIKKIKVVIDYEIKSLKNLFRSCNFIKKVSFTKFKRKDINDLSGMFYNCFNLEEIDLSKVKTNNVTDLSEMFVSCYSLKELNVTNFITTNVINMKGTFQHCSKLKELNVSNFDTTNVTNMESMFNGCDSLIQLDLSNFNTKNVTNMDNMFSYCKSLKELNLSNFNTEKVTDMGFMFDSIISLKKIKFL